jgi:hypothetical protein
VSKPTTAQKPVAQTGFCTDDKVCTIRPVSKPPPRASTEAPITVAARSVPTVNIRPGVSILAVLAHLEYKVWHALAEYVDNALQSFHAAAAKIRESDGPDARLKVEIEIESGHITITDNAGGIGIDAFPRAFRPAEIPTDCTGLSEFGMGMKSASCWFAPRWSVRTIDLCIAIGASGHKRSPA